MKAWRKRPHSVIRFAGLPRGASRLPVAKGWTRFEREILPRTVESHLPRCSAETNSEKKKKESPGKHAQDLRTREDNDAQEGKYYVSTHHPSKPKQRQTSLVLRVTSRIQRSRLSLGIPPLWLRSTSTPAYNNSCANSCCTRSFCEKYARKQRRCSCENLTWCMSVHRLQLSETSTGEYSPQGH